MIQVLVGMIASGKSSYSKLMAIHGHLCMNDDAIVTMLHGGNYNLYNKGYTQIYKTVENSVVMSILLQQKVAIIDRGTNISLKGRKRWISLAQTFETSCEAIVFKNEGPEVHARRRFEHDSRGHNYEYWLSVAQYHHSIYAQPTLEEGFSKIHVIDYKDILCVPKSYERLP